MDNQHNTKQVVKNLFSLSKLLAETLEREAWVQHQTDQDKISFTEFRTSSHTQPRLEQPLAGDGSAG